MSDISEHVLNFMIVISGSLYFLAETVAEPFGWA